MQIKQYTFFMKTRGGKIQKPQVKVQATQLRGLFTKRTISLLVFAALNITLAHGWVANPPARQHICASQGGNWWPEDGSGIPNAACRAAYQTNNTSLLYTQSNEYSANTLDYNNQAAVKQAVPNKLLCSAGRERYSGMSIAHRKWQKTRVKGGKFTLRFAATAPHNPSFWKIYISKPKFNPNKQKLKWRNLKLINEFPNLAVKAGTPDYYEMVIDLPTNRSNGAKAILFTRWQRIDQGGEGFYNCSDIVFSDKASLVDLPEPTDELSPIDPSNPITPSNVEVIFSTEQNWDTGFNGAIHITNNGSTKINNWELKFKLANDATANDAVWGAGGAINIASDGTATITPNAWGGTTIKPSDTISIYYGGIGTHAGAETCVFNGQNCNK